MQRPPRLCKNTGVFRAFHEIIAPAFCNSVAHLRLEGEFPFHRRRWLLGIFHRNFPIAAFMGKHRGFGLKFSFYGLRMVKLETCFKMRGFSYGNRNARFPQNRGSGSLRTGSSRGLQGPVRCRVLLARAAFQFSWLGMRRRHAIPRIEIRWGDKLLRSRNNVQSTGG